MEEFEKRKTIEENEKSQKRGRITDINQLYSFFDEKAGLNGASSRHSEDIKKKN